MRAPFYTILALGFLLFGSVYGQNSMFNASDCQQAVPICADSSVDSTLEGAGDISDFADAQGDFPEEVGCLTKGSGFSADIELNSGWYVFRTNQTGRFGFNIEQLTELDDADIDFALFGPFEDLQSDFCADVGLQGIEPIRCNSEEENGTAFTGVGVNPVSGQAGEPSNPFNNNTYDEWLDVQTGEVYYLYLNSFSLSPTSNFPPDFQLNFSGNIVDADANTALDCSIRDLFLGSNITACVGQNNIILSVEDAPLDITMIDTIRWSADTTNDGVQNPVALPEALGMEELVIEPLLENSGTYNVEIVPLSGDNLNASVVVTINEPPTVNNLNGVTIVDDLLNGMNDRLYTIRVNATGSGVYEYSIDNGVTFQNSPDFTNVAPGNYEGLGVVRDLTCGFETTFDFEIIGYPKFFTPNGDGTNDEWGIYIGSNDFVDPEIFIFDRFGKLLKQLQGTSTWDGTYIGRPMPSSDYWFKLQYRLVQGGEIRTLSSHFTLKR